MTLSLSSSILNSIVTSVYDINCIEQFGTTYSAIIVLRGRTGPEMHPCSFTALENSQPSITKYLLLLDGAYYYNYIVTYI